MKCPICEATEFPEGSLFEHIAEGHLGYADPAGHPAHSLKSHAAYFLKSGTESTEVGAQPTDVFVWEMDWGFYASDGVDGEHIPLGDTDQEGSVGGTTRQEAIREAKERFPDRPVSLVEDEGTPQYAKRVSGSKTAAITCPKCGSDIEQEDQPCPSCGWTPEGTGTEDSQPEEQEQSQSQEIQESESEQDQEIEPEEAQIAEEHGKHPRQEIDPPNPAQDVGEYVPPGENNQPSLFSPPQEPDQVKDQQDPSQGENNNAPLPTYHPHRLIDIWRDKTGAVDPRWNGTAESHGRPSIGISSPTHAYDREQRVTACGLRYYKDDPKRNGVLSTGIADEEKLRRMVNCKVCRTKLGLDKTATKYKRRIEYDGEQYVVKSDSAEIPDLGAMERIEALVWINQNTYPRGPRGKEPSGLEGLGDVIRFDVRGADPKRKMKLKVGDRVRIPISGYTGTIIKVEPRKDTPYKIRVDDEFIVHSFDRQEFWISPINIEKIAREPGFSEVAEQLYRAAQDRERAHTDMLERITKDLGGHLQGLEYNVKTKTSLQRKLQDEARISNLKPVEAASKISDALRYTMEYPEDTYSEAVHAAMLALKQQGHVPQPGKFKNYWSRGDVYDGINISMQGPNGYKWELQFHTGPSFRVKQKIHPLYDEFRHKSTPIPRRKELWEEMKSMWRDVAPPVGVMQMGLMKQFEFASLSAVADRILGTDSLGTELIGGVIYYSLDEVDDDLPTVWFRKRVNKDGAIYERRDIYGHWVEDDSLARHDLLGEIGHEFREEADVPTGDMDEDRPGLTKYDKQGAFDPHKFRRVTCYDCGQLTVIGRCHICGAATTDSHEPSTPIFGKWDLTASGWARTADNDSPEEATLEPCDNFEPRDDDPQVCKNCWWAIGAHAGEIRGYPDYKHGATKKTKRETNYRVAENPAQRCGNCSMFLLHDHSCTAVEGPIREDDTCDLWEARYQAAVEDAPTVEVGPDSGGYSAYLAFMDREIEALENKAKVYEHLDGEPHPSGLTTEEDPRDALRTLRKLQGRVMALKAQRDAYAARLGYPLLYHDEVKIVQTGAAEWIDFSNPEVYDKVGNVEQWPLDRILAIRQWENEDVVADPAFPRKRWEALKEDLKRNGIQFPFLVISRPRYDRLEDGNHRLAIIEEIIDEDPSYRTKFATIPVQRVKYRAGTKKEMSYGDAATAAISATDELVEQIRRLSDSPGAVSPVDEVCGGCGAGAPDYDGWDCIHCGKVTAASNNIIYSRSPTGMAVLRGAGTKAVKEQLKEIGFHYKPRSHGYFHNDMDDETFEMLLKGLKDKGYNVIPKSDYPEKHHFDLAASIFDKFPAGDCPRCGTDLIWIHGDYVARICPACNFVRKGDIELDRKILDYKPERSLQDQQQTREIEYLLPDASYKGYSSAPWFEEVNDIIGLNPNVGGKQYADKREAWFKRNVPKRSIPIGARLVVTQRTVNMDRIREIQEDPSSAGNEPIHTILQGGKYYILNGHHRLVADVLAGEGTIQARVLDMSRARAASMEKDGYVPATVQLVIAEGVQEAEAVLLIDPKDKEAKEFLQWAKQYQHDQKVNPLHKKLFRFLKGDPATIPLVAKVADVIDVGLDDPKVRTEQEFLAFVDGFYGGRLTEEELLLIANIWHDEKNDHASALDAQAV